MKMISPPRLTKLLLAVLLLAGGLQLFAWMRMQHALDDATLHANDFADVRADLNDLDHWHVSAPSQGAFPNGSPTVPPISGDTAFNRHLRAAADAAQIPTQIASIEPGPPARLHDTEFTETPVYVRLNEVSLRQLITFLYQLSSTDRSLRSKAIELSAPEQPALAKGSENQTELWTADLTLNTLAFSPEPHDTR